MTERDGSDKEFSQVFHSFNMFRYKEMISEQLERLRQEKEERQRAGAPTPPSPAPPTDPADNRHVLQPVVDGGKADAGGSSHV